MHLSVPAKTFDEFVAWAKVNRGQLTYANYGPGTLSHFLGYQVSERYGLNFTQISYRGNAPQMVDLIAGHVLFGFTQQRSCSNRMLKRQSLWGALADIGRREIDVS